MQSHTSYREEGRKVGRERSREVKKETLQPDMRVSGPRGERWKRPPLNSWAGLAFRLERVGRASLKLFFGQACASAPPLGGTHGPGYLRGKCSEWTNGAVWLIRPDGGGEGPSVFPKGGGAASRCSPGLGPRHPCVDTGWGGRDRSTIYTGSG